jgi:hypothetical protein
MKPAPIGTVSGTRCYVARKAERKRRRYRFGFNQSGPYLVKRQAIQSDVIGMMEFPVTQVWTPKTAPGPERDPDYGGSPLGVINEDVT